MVVDDDGRAFPVTITGKVIWSLSSTSCEWFTESNVKRDEDDNDDDEEVVVVGSGWSAKGCACIEDDDDEGMRGYACYGRGIGFHPDISQLHVRWWWWWSMMIMMGLLISREIGVNFNEGVDKHYLQCILFYFLFNNNNNSSSFSSSNFIAIDYWFYT